MSPSALEVKLAGRLGVDGAPTLSIVPPNPDTRAQVFLQIQDGAAYCVGFGGAAGGTVVNEGPELFRVSRATAAACS